MAGGGAVRIIAGQWRGRKLKVPVVADLRPTGDRVRETLFNWLQFEWEGSRWLDVFAGSGALGFEALSRGASEVVMLETHAKAFAQLAENQALLGATGAHLVKADAWQWLRNKPERGFDGIFLDPPFREERLAELMALIVRQGWLLPGGWVYVEQPSGRQLALDGWEAWRQQTLGGVQFGLWRPVQGERQA